MVDPERDQHHLQRLRRGQQAYPAARARIGSSLALTDVAVPEGDRRPDQPGIAAEAGLEVVEQRLIGQT